MFRVARLFLQQRLEPGAIRYVASDMDGTVLNAHHALSDFTKWTLFQLTQQRKIPFIFATGRVHADVAVVNTHLQEFFRVGRAAQHMKEESPVTATPVYLITSNGAVAHNARTNEVVMERTIPPVLVRELYDLLPASETRINTHFCQRDGWYCRMDWKEMLQFHKESGHTYQLLEKIPTTVTPKPHVGGEGIWPPSPLDSAKIFIDETNKVGTAAADGNRMGSYQTMNAKAAPLLTPPEGDISKVTKLFFTSWDKPLLDKLETLLHERYDDQLNINYSASYCIDVTAKGANKATALRAVLSILPPEIHTGGLDQPLTAEQEKQVDVRIAACAAFGNDLNDCALLRAVGRGFLMSNSNPRLVEACPGLEQIGHHHEDGVAKQLCTLFDLKVKS